MSVMKAAAFTQTFQPCHWIINWTSSKVTELVSIMKREVHKLSNCSIGSIFGLCLKPTVPEFVTKGACVHHEIAALIHKLFNCAIGSLIVPHPNPTVVEFVTKGTCVHHESSTTLSNCSIRLLIGLLPNPTVVELVTKGTCVYHESSSTHTSFPAIPSDS